MVTFVPKKLTRVLIAHFLFSINAFLPLFHVYPILTPSMGKPAQFVFPQSHLVNNIQMYFFNVLLHGNYQEFFNFNLS